MWQKKIIILHVGSVICLLIQSAKEFSFTNVFKSLSGTEMMSLCEPGVVWSKSLVRAAVGAMTADCGIVTESERCLAACAAECSCD